MQVTPEGESSKMRGSRQMPHSPPLKHATDHIGNVAIQ